MSPASPARQPRQSSRVSLFVSAVSAEFAEDREVLRHELAAPSVDIKIQEDFIAAGSTTLRKLDDYIRHCDAVIHLVGERTGAAAHAQALADLCQDYPALADKLPPLAPCLGAGAPALSYTQWEAWLALYHGKELLICVPEGGAPRATDAAADADGAQRAAQQAHLKRLQTAGYYPQVRFADAKALALRVRSSTIGRLLDAAARRSPPRRLPWSSLGKLFAGRAPQLRALAKAFGAPPTRAAPVVARVIHGIGGVGKTRLAIEYAWRRESEYTAIFFVSGSDPGVLAAHIAALAAPDILKLPESQASEHAVQHAAVLRWLNDHPGWLLIVDELDTPEAAQAAAALLPQLAGGHVLLTSRLAHWSAELSVRELPTLTPAAARNFLLQRTADRRRKRPDDAASAGALAHELGQLALALEQAGAYIATNRQSLAAYLADWRQDDAQRRAALAWYDARLMHYPKSVAQTWQTSFDRLSDGARVLLRGLAWLAPEAIPESLLDTLAAAAADDEAAAALARARRAALSELEGYSLVHREDDGADDRVSFSLHRLVQTVSRDQQYDEAQRAADDKIPPALHAALAWLDDAFVGVMQDVRDWPRLDPLAPHAQAVAAYADAAAIAAPTARLFSDTAMLLHAKARYGEAEPLLRRALAIGEASLGSEHPNLATYLNNLAQLLQATNRVSEAEPLMRRALAIDEASLGSEHPNVAIDLNNLAQLLQETNRVSEAEPLMRRALAIDEASLGSEHPGVAIDLNNLAALLHETNRMSDAEPLMRRALAIDEASLGREHPTIAIRLNNLAQLLQATNRQSEAEPLLRRALRIFFVSLGDDHPHTQIVRHNAIALLHALGRSDDEIAATLADGLAG